jgi:hypothetical protein
MAACAGGDLNALMDLLAPDVTSWSDGGGVVTAALRPLYGPDHVARWVLGVLAKPIVAGFELESATINGELGVLARIGGAPVAAVAATIPIGVAWVAWAQLAALVGIAYVAVITDDLITLRTGQHSAYL